MPYGECRLAGLSAYLQRKTTAEPSADVGQPLISWSSQKWRLLVKFIVIKTIKLPTSWLLSWRTARPSASMRKAANQSHFSDQVQTEIDSVYLSFRFLLDIDHDSLLTSAKGRRWWHCAIRNTQNAIIVQCVWLLSESEWRIDCSEMFNHRNFATLSHPPPVKNTSIQKREKKKTKPVDDEGLYVKSAIISNRHWGRR